MSQKDGEVIWSPLAEKEVEQQLKHITQKWGMQASIDYLERIDEVLKAVINNPATYYQVDARRHNAVLPDNGTCYWPDYLLGWQTE